MKTIGLALILVFSTAILHGQPRNVAGGVANERVLSTNVMDRGGNFKSIDTLRERTEESGRAVTVTNHYVKVQNGLHWKDAQGNWIESKPFIQPFESQLVCTGTTFRAILNNDIHTYGSVDIELPDGQRFVSHPLGIALFDPKTGRREWLAEVGSCQAAISGNHVIYPQAIQATGNITATITYEFSVGKIQQDITFLTKPSLSPSNFKMGDDARLEMVTEIVQWPQPTANEQIIKRGTNDVTMVETNLSNSILRFGKAVMPLGYSFPSGNAHRRGVPTAKKVIVTEDHRTLLLERLEWRDVAANLEALPLHADTGAPRRNEPLARKLGMPDKLVADEDRATGTFATRLARVNQTRPKSVAALSGAALPSGFTFDYELVDDSEGTWTFESNQTYLLDHVCYFYSIAIQADAVLKFTPGAGISMTYGSATFPSSGTAILTAVDDHSIGEKIGTGTLDGFYADPAFGASSYYSFTPSHLDIRHATTALYLGCLYGTTVDNCSFYHCNSGILGQFGGSDDISIDQVTFCDVATPYDGCISVGTVNSCADSDGDGLPDHVEQANGTSTTLADTDYDGRSDYQEMYDGTSALDATSVVQLRLAYFRFNDTNTWVGATNQLPLTTSNLLGVTSWSSNAVRIDRTNAAVATLRYRETETNGLANLNVRNGTVRFWFKANWLSTNAGGAGPGGGGRLLEAGSYSTNLTNGWWALLLNSSGTALQFASATNGSCATNLSATISWDSTNWQQVALTYTPSNYSLYVNGQAEASGTGAFAYPSAAQRAASGFRLGGDHNGTNQARGDFDELETFNYPLSADTILANYQTILLQDSDGDGLTDLAEYRLGCNPGSGSNPDTDGDGVNDNLEKLQGRNPNVAGVWADTNNVTRLVIYTPLR